MIVKKVFQKKKFRSKKFFFPKVCRRGAPPLHSSLRLPFRSGAPRRQTLEKKLFRTELFSSGKLFWQSFIFGKQTFVSQTFFWLTSTLVKKRLGEPCSQPIFTSVRASPAGQNGLFRNNEVSIHDHKIFKNGRKIKFFSFSERYTSKLSVGGFWALWDH